MLIYLELKQALQHLSSEHPETYEKFIHSLRPPPSDQLTHEPIKQPTIRSSSQSINMRIYNNHGISSSATRPSYDASLMSKYDPTPRTDLKVSTGFSSRPDPLITSPRPGLYDPYNVHPLAITSALSGSQTVPVVSIQDVHDIEYTTTYVLQCTSNCCFIVLNVLMIIECVFMLLLILHAYFFSSFCMIFIYLLGHESTITHT